jgi:hypothetical protein
MIEYYLERYWLNVIDTDTLLPNGFVVYKAYYIQEGRWSIFRDTTKNIRVLIYNEWKLIPEEEAHAIIMLEELGK